jgi:hypothetical protein
MLDDMRFCSFAAIFVLVLCCVPSSFAQLDRGWIEGQVLDAHHLQPIEAAELKLLDSAGTILQGSKTDRSGKYYFQGLRSSEYRLEIRKPAYVTSTIDRIRVLPGYSSVVDAEMIQQRQGSEMRTVHWEGRPVNLWASDSGTVFDRDRLEGLPGGRNIWSLLDSQEISTVTNQVQEGGLQTGLIGLASVHGSSWTQNTYLLNGINVTNPYEPGKPLVYPSLGSLEEVRDSTALHAADSSAPGFSLQLTNKKGGREFHAQAEAYYLGPPFQNDASPIAQKFKNFEEGEASAGGPVPDFARWSFFADAAFQRLSTSIPDFSAAPRTDLSSGLLRLDRFVRPQDQLTIVVDGQSIRLSNLGAQPHVAPTATLRGYHRFEVVQGYWTHAHSPATLWKISFGFSHSSPTDTLQSDVTKPNATQLFTGQMDGAAPLECDAAISRFSSVATGQTLNQLRLGWQNRLDYGIDWEESMATEERRVFQSIRLLFFQNAPSEVIQYNTPSHAMQRSRALSFFFNDSLRVSSRLFLRLGINFDASGAWLPKQQSGAGAFAPARQFGGAGGIISWKNVSPRIGIAVPVFERIGARVFAGYSRTYYLLPAGYADYANPTGLSGKVFRWNDSNQDLQYQPGEEGVLLRRFGSAYSSVDPDLQRPYTDEWAIGIKQSFGRKLEWNLKLLRSNQERLIKLINTGVPSTAYVPVNVLDLGDDALPGTRDDRIITVFNQDPRTLGQDRYLLTNPPGENAHYKGVEASLNAALSRRGTISVSFTAYKSVGRGSAGNSEFENDPGAVEGLYTDPNAFLNSLGRLYFDRAYIGKIAAFVRAPFGFDFGTVMRYYDGLPFGRKLIIPDLNQGPFFVMATPRGEPGGFRTQYNLTFDQRISRDFKVGRQKLAFLVDIFNLLNQKRDLQEYDFSGPLFSSRTPTAVENPRVIRFGLRWNL